MLKIVEGELISQMAEQVSNKDSGCDYMFKNQRLDELKLMYSVFKRDALTLRLIICKMNPFILERGDKIVKDESMVKNPVEFTRKLISFKAEIDAMVKESFSDDMKFQTARDKSFQEFMNGQPFTAKYLAVFADHELRVGFKGVADLEIDQRLCSITDLFRCLHNRDEFLANYQREL